MIYILNFNNSRNLSDVEYYYREYKATNIDFILEDFSNGLTNWSVPKGAKAGDIAVFMCAKTARNNLGLATSHIPAGYPQDFYAFVDQQKFLYKKYSGCLLGFGIVKSTPIYNTSENWWKTEIIQLRQFETPIHIDEFRNFITISKTGSITYISQDQWERLKLLVNSKNAGFFQETILLV